MPATLVRMVAHAMMEWTATLATVFPVTLVTNAEQVYLIIYKLVIYVFRINMHDRMRQL